MEKPKKLILDYSTWRSGGKGENMVGFGDTLLLNCQGEMCCLGQWMLQCGIPEIELRGTEAPACLERYSSDNMKNRVEKANLFIDDKGVNTHFSEYAIAINDDCESTPEEKITELQELLKEYEIELEVINKPT